MNDSFYKSIEKQDAEQDAEQLEVAKQDVAIAILKQELKDLRKGFLKGGLK